MFLTDTDKEKKRNCPKDLFTGRSGRDQCRAATEHCRHSELCFFSVGRGSIHTHTLCIRQARSSPTLSPLLCVCESPYNLLLILFFKAHHPPDEWTNNYPHSRHSITHSMKHLNAHFQEGKETWKSGSIISSVYYKMKSFFVDNKRGRNSLGLI